MADEFRKPPSDVLDYVFDWSAWLAKYGDTIYASSMAVLPTGLDITSKPSTFTPTYSTVWAASGVNGQTYLLSNTITTAAGRVRTRSMKIIVQNQ